MPEQVERFGVAAIQFEPTLGAKTANVERLLELTRDACARGAALIVLPEMATTGYCWYDRAEVRPYVEPIPGPTTDAVAALAREHRCWIVVGMPEVDPATDVFYNAAALIGPGGVAGVYRKSHSADSEGKWAGDGDLGLPVWETPLGRLGILICADAHYVEPARVLALQGADVLCLPANWQGAPCPPDSWIARAWENGCYLAAANRHGVERGIQFGGGSCVIDPDGAVMARQGEGDGIVLAQIDVARARTRAFAPGLPPEKVSARRPDLYDAVTLNTYLYNPLEFHGLYGHRPLPRGGRSRVAVAQMAPTPGDVRTNLRTIEGALAGLAGPVDLVVFPEYALTGRPSCAAEVVDRAQPTSPPWLDELVDLARRYQTALVVGYLERAGEACYSTALAVGGDGELGRARKAHPIAGEAEWCRPGPDRPPVIDLEHMRVGVLVGTDLCFPEAARALALDGCDLLAVPAGSALSPVVDAAALHLARLRAVENACYLAFASAPSPGGVGWSGVFAPERGPRAEEWLIPPDATGVSLRAVDTTNLATPFPTSVVRAKESLRRRRPGMYALLQHPRPPALDLFGAM